VTPRFEFGLELVEEISVPPVIEKICICVSN